MNPFELFARLFKAVERVIFSEKKRLARTLTESHTGSRVGQRVVRILRNQGGANVILAPTLGRWLHRHPQTLVRSAPTN